MGNELKGEDFAPHAVMGAWNYLLDWATTAEIKDVLMAGYHQKMRIRNIYIMNVGAALNAGEPVINIRVGGNEVVETIDMATFLEATAPIGATAECTLIDTYSVIDVDDSLQIEVESVDGGADTRGLVMFNLELVE